MTILNDYFDLHNWQEEKHKTLEYIQNNVSFRWANLWILACAILIASVWLNLNSTAVVIGAMLISPLMWPIISAWFSLGVYDFTLLKRAIKNLLIATFVSIFIATIYFYITPFKEVQSEILARTSPTFFDIIIAFAGGIVGIITITRVEKGNPLPWVAIATALMPPLCTAWYSIANGNLYFFLWALYLYIINLVFIFIATFLIVRHLRYPLKQYIDTQKQVEIRRILTATTIVILIPAILLAYSLFWKEKFRIDATRFLKQEFTEKWEVILSQKIIFSPQKEIEVATIGSQLSETDKEVIQSHLNDFEWLQNTKLKIIQGGQEVDVSILKKNILSELNLTESTMTEKDKTIQKLQEIISQSTFDSFGITKEVNLLYPEIKTMEFFKENKNYQNDTNKSTIIAIYQSINPLSWEKFDTLWKWLIQRLQVDSVEMYHKQIVASTWSLESTWATIAIQE